MILSKIGSIILLGACLQLFGQEPIEPNGYGKKSSEILDIKSWNNSVEKIFRKNKLILTKVEYYKDDTYPVYFVDFPWDPMSGMNSKILKRLEAEIFVEIGQTPYAITDLRDKIRIEMTLRNKGKKKPVLEENIVILEGGQIF